MLHGRCLLGRTISATCLRGTFASAPRRSLVTLAIESSCDDTCVSILSKNETHDDRKAATARVLFNEKITAKNTGKGGIVPTEALNTHQHNLAHLLEKAFAFLPDTNDTSSEFRRLALRDGKLKQKPDFISVTRGPGMLPSLSVGLATAKGLSTAWQIPMVGVHHMQAHALTPRLVNAMQQDGSSSRKAPEPAFPFLTLLVSGGHTMLVYSKGLVEHEVLATTTDTAIGDELDKCGRLILPTELQQETPDTSFGKYLSAYAFRSPEEFTSWRVPRTRSEEVDHPVNDFGWKFSTPMSESKDLAFSFAGIASQVKRLMPKLANDKAFMEDTERILLARSALGAAFEHLGSRTVIALEKLRAERVEISSLVVSGGVAANDFLRYYVRKLLDMRGFKNVKLVFPPVELCTDNAVMIGWAGFEMFEAGYRTDLGCTPVRRWSMDSRHPDGGILGIGGWSVADDPNVAS